MSIRSVYGSYLDRLNYDIDGNDPLVPYVSLMTFYSICKRDFPHVKVSHQAEDTCTLCDQFANRHKFAIAGSTASNSTADGSLFTTTDNDYGKNLPDLDDPPPESDDDGEDKDEGRGVTTTEESQAAGQGENPEEESEVDRILTNPMQ